MPDLRARLGMVRLPALALLGGCVPALLGCVRPVDGSTCLLVLCRHPRPAPCEWRWTGLYALSRIDSVPVMVPGRSPVLRLTRDSLEVYECR